MITQSMSKLQWFETHGTIGYQLGTVRPYVYRSYERYKTYLIHLQREKNHGLALSITREHHKISAPTLWRVIQYFEHD